MFWSRPPWFRQGSAFVGDVYAGALMSFGTYVHGWKTANPFSVAPSLGSSPRTRSRESVQTTFTAPGTAET